ncbi:hypothetical protein UFOVP250_154 [uncultured Caudovirales phage]|uniref:Uncharacterized protein n=1 Tax=uncultured Caudovirales phage TaxID=2100421 RepID=A0A6J5LFP2_9CAUD|nr:hypothetical protein UFOVP250_154 [uncultured Caudovirales phage]
MIEGVDYCFIYPKSDDQAVHIKLLDGPFKDVVFQYGKVKIEEKDGAAYLLFNYFVIESPNVKIKKLEKDNDFKNYIGDMLVEVMSANIEQEIIDETGTDDITQPDL